MSKINRPRKDRYFQDAKHRVAEDAPKIRAARPTVEKSRAGYEKRRRQLLEQTAEPDATAEIVADFEQDLQANRAIANLLLGRFVEAANARIRRAAEWFDHPPILGRPVKGPCTFIAEKLCRTWYHFADSDLLSDETRGRIRRYFLEFEFDSFFESENHILLFRTARYLMAQAFPDETWKGYHRKGRTLLGDDDAWLKQYLRYRASHGWGEFDSLVYIQPDWDCLLSLYDYAEDAEMRRLAGRMCDLRLAEMAVESHAGMQGGAHGRIYSCDALDYAETRAYTLHYLYFGNVDPATAAHRSVPVDCVMSSFRPHELVLDVALDDKRRAERTYLVRKRTHLHNTKDKLPKKPMDRSVRKQTLMTPHFMIGSIQRQDPYPPRCPGRWYAHHEQHEWDLSFPTRTRSRIFTHHPGERHHEHGKWTGDLRCCCGKFFHHGTAVLAIYDIPAEQPHQHIHAHVPKVAFDAVVEEGGWIFVREGKAGGALRMLGGHEWVADGPWKDIEVISPGAKNAAVCEAGLLSEFGGFAKFRREILANKIDFDAKRMRLTYHSRRNGLLLLDAKDGRSVDGEAVDMDYPLIESPYLNAEWGGGVAILKNHRRRLRLDFTPGDGR